MVLIVVALLTIGFAQVTTAEAQTAPFDQTFVWNAYREVVYQTSISSPWFEIHVPRRNVQFYYLEVHARVTNRGPGAFAFDIFGEMSTPSSVNVCLWPLDLVKLAYASQGYIAQAVGIGWVNEGFAADVVFSVDFLGQAFQVGPPGTPVLNADRVNYYDNTLFVSQAEYFSVRIRLESYAVSQARLWVEDTRITVRGVSSGEIVPEFVSAPIALLVVLVVGSFLVNKVARKKGSTRNE